MVNLIARIASTKKPLRSDATIFRSAMSTRPAQQAVSVRVLTHNPAFLRLWLGQLLSQIGDQALLIASLHLISQLSDSVTALLIPALSLVLPQALFGLVGGVVADRWNRRHLMIASDILRGVIVLSLIAVPLTQHLGLLYLAVALMALVSVFFYPARNALIPNIVPLTDLWSANALIQGSTVLALVIGPSVAGLVIGMWGVNFAFIFDAITFFVSALAIASLGRMDTVTLSNGRTKPPATVRQELMEGLRFIAGHRLLKQVLALVAMATLGIASIVLLAVHHLDEALNVGALGYGFAMTTLGAGSVLGGLLSHRLAERFRARYLVSGMLIIAAIAIVLFAYAPWYTLVLVSLALLGLSVVSARGALDTLTQLLAPDDVRGRVQSAVNLIINGATAGAEAFSAVLGDLIGVRQVFLAASLLTLLAAFSAYRVLEHFQDHSRPGGGHHET